MMRLLKFTNESEDAARLTVVSMELTYFYGNQQTRRVAEG